MEKLITDAILHIKQVSKKKVSLENLLQGLNKSAATNINSDNLKIEIESMLRKGLIDQDFKMLGKQSEQTSTSINNIRETQSFPEIKDLDNRNEENKADRSPLPLTQETPRALPFDHPRLSKSINSEDDLEFLGTQDTPLSSLTLKNMLDVSTQATNKISSGYEIELEDINAKMMALKAFLMNEIYDLRQEIEKRDKNFSKNNRSIEEMKSKLQCYERENQILKDENASKKNIIETILNQNNELIKLNNSICSRNQTGIDKDTTIKSSEPPKQNDFQRPRKTNNRYTPEKVSTSDTFISPNRFGNLFYDASIKDTEEKTDDCFTNQESVLFGNNIAVQKKKNENIKNNRRPLVVPNNHPENQTVYSRKSVVPGEKSYSDALIENEKKENHDKNDNYNIKIFTDSIPKGIKVKELNEQIHHGHARVHSFPGATSKQLLHDLDVNIDDSTDTVLIHIGVNDILQSVSNMDRLLLNVREMVRKCRLFGLKNMFVSGLVYTRRIRVNILNDLQKKLVDICREMNV